LQFLVLQLSGSIDVQRTVDPILTSVSRCEIPYEESRVIVDMMKGQIHIPVKITLTETHLHCLKTRLPANVTSIEVGSATI